MSLETRVRELEHRDAIQELRYRYALYIDHRRWDDLIGLFTSDATCTYAGVGTFEATTNCES